MAGGETSKWKTVRKLLPGVLISGVALWLVLRTVSWEGLGDALATLSLGSLALVILIYFISLFARVFGWYILLQRQIPFKRAFMVMNEGYLLNNIFPFRLGEVGRAVLLGSNTKIGILPVFSTVIVERSYDLAIGSSLLLATLPFVLGMNGSRALALTILGLVFIALTTLFVLARWREPFLRWLNHLPVAWKFFKAKIIPGIGSVLEGFSVLNRPSLFILSLSMLLLSWGLALVEDYLLLRNVAPQAPFWWVAFAISAAALGAGLPSIPGGIGIYEAAIVGALALVGVDSEPALAFALVSHLIGFGFPIIIGAIGLALEGETLSAIYQKIKTRQI
jgi:glycosyltransferase 2 family protein